MATSTISSQSAPISAPPSTVVEPIVDEFSVKLAVEEIDSSIASTVRYLRDEKDACPKTALVKLKPAVAHIHPVLEWIKVVVSEIDQTQGDADGFKGTINVMQEFMGIWIEYEKILNFLESKLAQVETIFLNQEGDAPEYSNEDALKTLTGAINHANGVLGSLWMDIVDFPQSTIAIQDES